MTAWGKTGRVTRDSREILVDGMPVGYACAGYAEVYAERLGKPWTTTAAPSRDAAILWVLRRVDPALWRQERGEVPAVFPTPHGEWMVSHVSGRVVNPSWFDTRTEAFAYAHRVAAKAATR